MRRENPKMFGFVKATESAYRKTTKDRRVLPNKAIAAALKSSNGGGKAASRSDFAASFLDQESRSRFDEGRLRY
jgi:hypothetical protein